MSEAMKFIVDGYVKLCARKELDDLKAHRCRLAIELESLNGPFDLTSSTVEPIKSRSDCAVFSGAAR